MKSVSKDALNFRVIVNIALTLIDHAKHPTALEADGQDANSGNEKYR